MDNEGSMQERFSIEAALLAAELLEVQNIVKSYNTVDRKNYGHIGDMSHAREIVAVLREILVDYRERR